MNIKVAAFTVSEKSNNTTVNKIWDRIRHFSVAPYITICPSTETYFGLYLRGARSAVTGIYLFRLLLNIIFFALRSFFLP